MFIRVYLEKTTEIVSLTARNTMGGRQPHRIPQFPRDRNKII